MTEDLDKALSLLDAPAEIDFSDLDTGDLEEVPDEQQDIETERTPGAHTSPLPAQRKGGEGEFALNTDTHNLEFSDVELHNNTVSEPVAKTVKAELRSMNQYLENLSNCFGMATSVADVCHIVRTGMGVIKDRRILLANALNLQNALPSPKKSKSSDVVLPIP